MSGSLYKNETCGPTSGLPTLTSPLLQYYLLRSSKLCAKLQYMKVYPQVSGLSR